MISEEQVQKSLDDIFSCIRKIEFLGQTYFLTPFNQTAVQRKVQDAIDDEYSERVGDLSPQVIADLEQVLIETKKTGGTISKDLYEQYHFAINTVSRDLVHARWMGMGASKNYDRFDTESVEISSELKHLADEIYGEHHDINIGKNIKENFEGTHFQRGYDLNGNLELFRIFHQAHRAKLQVSTVDLPKLLEKMNKIVLEKKAGKKEVDCSLPFNEETFAYEKIVTFNELSAPHLSLNIFQLQKIHIQDVRDPIIAIEFSESHDLVAQKMMSYLREQGIETGSLTRSGRTSFWKKEDFFLIDVLERHVVDPVYPSKLRLDNGPASIKSYLLFNDHTFSFPMQEMIKRYVLESSLK